MPKYRVNGEVYTAESLEELEARLAQQAPVAPTGVTYGQTGGPTAMPNLPSGPNIAESSARGLQDFGEGTMQSIYDVLEAAGLLPAGTAQAYTAKAQEGREAYAAKRVGVRGADIPRSLASIAPLFLFPQQSVSRGFTGAATKLGAPSRFAAPVGQAAAGAVGGALGGATAFAPPGTDKGDLVAQSAVFGGALPLVGMAGRKMFGGTPSESQALMAQRARSANPPIPLTPKEEFGGALTPRFEAGLNMTLGGSAAFKALERRQREALTANVAGQLGQRAKEFTPQVRDAIEQRIDDLYANALRGKAVMPDRQLLDDFAAILHEQAARPQATQNKFIIEYIRGGLGAKTNIDPAWTRPMSASLYNKQRSRLGKQAVDEYKSGTADDGEALSALQDALDNWAARRLGPDSTDALREARRLNRVWMTTQGAIDEATSQIDPAKFAKVMTRDRANDPALAPLRELTDVAYNIRTRPFSPIGIGLGVGIPTLVGGLTGGPNEALENAAYSFGVPLALSAFYLNPALRKTVSLPARGAEQALMRGAAPLGGLFAQ